MSFRLKACVILCAAAWLAQGCSSAKPVLYPNARYNQVGKAQAQADINECMRLAREHGVSSTSKSKEVARETAAGTAVGAAVGGAVGSMSGEFGRGAAIGALGGGAGSMTRSVLKSNNPDPTFKNFVDRCLREKGYEPVGWQ
ncbi:conserved hypothetical protein [Desulfatibacillum aliphaticivorans]|uniref:Glycine-zipper-containing OmpA-like membrane domain-containing protein n=1 Tax=Desulfatibacillum aliphaticivorans TaxID=218208 RepID=B8FIB5_DESAL|nr:glycine zipper family protein [Desulfatibacillum aliphaticivorans]ACL02682.1 conserved hypothetical protein [Desulfatibacillum aliphaticivorans]